MCCFGTFSLAGGGGGGEGGRMHQLNNFVVYASLIVKFGTGMELDVFYTIVTRNCRPEG